MDVRNVEQEEGGKESRIRECQKFRGRYLNVRNVEQEGGEDVDKSVSGGSAEEDT
jgi:hypothetical protein